MLVLLSVSKAQRKAQIHNGCNCGEVEDELLGRALEGCVITVVYTVYLSAVSYISHPLDTYCI